MNRRNFLSTIGFGVVITPLLLPKKIEAKKEYSLIDHMREAYDKHIEVYGYEPGRCEMSRDCAECYKKEIKDCACIDDEYYGIPIEVTIGSEWFEFCGKRHDYDWRTDAEQHRPNMIYMSESVFNAYKKLLAYPLH